MENNIYKFVSKEKLDLVCNSIEKAHGLPNECYIDEEYTKLERKLLFEDNWVAIGVASSLPNIGDAKPFDLLGIPLILLRHFSPQCAQAASKTSVSHLVFQIHL